MVVVVFLVVVKVVEVTAEEVVEVDTLVFSTTM